MIPKFSSVQTKMIRTYEGILVIAFNGAMLIVPIVTNALPAATAVKYAAIVNTGAVIARQIAKAVGQTQAPFMADTPEMSLTDGEEFLSVPGVDPVPLETAVKPDPVK